MSGDGVRTPALVVDVGDTLLRRETPGAFGRVADALRGEGIDTTDERQRRFAAEAVLTSASLAQAVDALAGLFELGFGGRQRMLAALREPESPAVIVEGAPELLRGARRHGWRVVVATNAVAWASELPPELAAQVDVVVSSSGVGCLKQSPRFWAQLLCEAGVAPALSLVLGDNFDADVLAPRSAGFASVHVADATLALTELADAVEAAGPAPADSVAVVVGRPTRWADCDVVEAPHLAPLVARVTRARMSLDVGGGRARSAIVVRREHGPPVVVPNAAEPLPFLSWMTERPDRRSATPPRDLDDALRQRRLSLDTLPLHERRYLISLVREAARDSAVRTSRVAHVVEHLEARARAGAT